MTRAHGRVRVESKTSACSLQITWLRATGQRSANCVVSPLLRRRSRPSDHPPKFSLRMAQPVMQPAKNVWRGERLIVLHQPFPDSGLGHWSARFPGRTVLIWLGTDMNMSPEVDVALIIPKNRNSFKISRMTGPVPSSPERFRTVGRQLLFWDCFRFARDTCIIEERRVS
jgi:hypothetical protein